jgi:methionine salvage enolase-phosphatase E1
MVSVFFYFNFQEVLLTYAQQQLKSYLDANYDNEELKKDIEAVWSQVC